METRANYIIVGVFTIVAVLSAFAFVYWTAAIGDRGETAELRIRIPGSAAGLGRGSAVLFNGVRVGDLRRVFIDVNDPDAAIAIARIDRATPVTASTQVDVGLAGLTGQANVEMRGAAPGERSLLDMAEEAGVIAEVTARPSAVTNLIETAQSIFRRTDEVLLEFEGFVQDVRGPLTESARNAQAFSEALGRNADGIDTFLASVAEMSETLGGVSGQLEATLQAGEELMRAVDAERVNAVITNVENFTRQLDEAAGGIDQIMTGLQSAVASLDTFSDSANQTLARVDGIVDSVDPDSVRAVIGNFETASATVDRVATDVASLTDGINARAGDIDRFIDEAVQVAERMNRSSEGIESVVARVDSLLDSEDIEAIVANSRQAVQRYLELGDSLVASSERVDRIVAGIDPDAVQAMLRNFESASATADRVATDVASLTDGINARAGDIDRFIDEAVRIAERLNRSSEGIESVVARVDSILDSEEMEAIVADSRQTIQTYRELGESLVASSERVDRIVAGIDPDAVQTMLRNFETASGTVERIATDVGGFTDRLTARTDDIDRIVTDAQQLADRLNRASERVEGVVTRVDDILATGDAEGMMSDARETLQAYRQLAERLTESSQRIDQVLAGIDDLLGSDEAEGMMSEAGRTLEAYRTLAERLTESGARLDSVLTRADDLLGAEHIEGVIAEANETLRVFRETAQALDARVGTVTTGLQRFSDRGLRDVEALVRDSRRSIARIEQAITSFERNPQRILTGGEGSVRQYDGRQRR